MRKVAILTSHFPPSNLTSVHRSRLWARYLPKFGWYPIIITCHYKYYEESLDFNLQTLLPKWLRIIRVPAFKTKPFRIVGDAGIRSFYWIYKALCELCENEKVDFILITIPSNFIAPIGVMISAKFGIPYGIDYIDPWVHEWPGSNKIGTKSWLSRKLADLLEPISVERAKLITGINHMYYSGMIKRNPAVHTFAITAEMPYGFDFSDFKQTFTLKERPLQRIKKNTQVLDEKIWVYAGAFLPNSTEVYKTLFKALAYLKKQKRIPPQGVKLFFIGTGKSPTDPDGYQVMPLAKLSGVEDLVYEYPCRMNYLEVLSCLIDADGIFIIGSFERHYSPSKVYQALASGRPILAILHKECTAWKWLDCRWGCECVKIETDGEIQTSILADALANAFTMKKDFSLERSFLINTEVYAAINAQSLARALNKAIDSE